MGNLYLGNQKSALNKAFVNEGISDYISVGLCYVSSDLYYEANDALSVYTASENPENMFDDSVETYFDGSYLNLKSSKGKIKEIVVDIQSNYWDSGIDVYATDDDYHIIGDPTYNQESWTNIGILPIGYGNREVVTYTLDKPYKYVALRIDRKSIYSLQVKVERTQVQPKPVYNTVYPNVAITTDSENYFVHNAGEGEQFLNYDGDVAFLGSYEDSYQILNKDSSVSMANSYMWIKFKDPFAIKAISAKIGSSGWRLYGTNDEELFKNSINYNQVNSNYGTTLMASGIKCDDAMKDFTVNEEGVAYKYYMFATSGTWAYVYEIALKA